VQSVPHRLNPGPPGCTIRSVTWQTALGVQMGLTVAAAALVYLGLRRQRKGFGTLEERATLRTLAFATSTLSTLRQGLSERSAAKVLPEVEAQAGAPAVALYGPDRLLAYHAAATGPGRDHRPHVAGEAGAVLEALGTGRLRIVHVHQEDRGGEACTLKTAVVAPLLVNERPVAALVTYHAAGPGPAGLRIASDLSELLATQLRLQAAETQRMALARSELKALRAQISPHFIYNSLNTIAAFIRTDPDRARQLIIDFADFTRRAFASPESEFATLADELVYVNQYLVVEQARLGERLQVRFHIEPEVLSITVPALILQPLVENAVKHGIEDAPGGGVVEITAEDEDDECLITVRDDGSGFQPQLGADGGGALFNIDNRLRQVFGPGHGLAIHSETKSGTTVRLRVPKYRPGVRAS
jgi:two-component system LytT family sensor kinase